MTKFAWYSRPITALALTFALIVFSIFFISHAEFGVKDLRPKVTFSVTMRDYGVDAREIEQSITIPLEDALSTVSGITGLVSSSEYGESKVIIHFNTRDLDAAYEAVRDVAQRVYESLPSSVQRPEIVSGNNDNNPVWVSAIYSNSAEVLNDMDYIIDKKIKPAIERLDGVGRVLVSGIMPKEVAILVNDQAAASIGIFPSNVASHLSLEDVLEYSGTIFHNNKKLPILADGRLASVEDISNVYMMSRYNKPVQLKNFTTIIERNRRPETISRLDASLAFTIAVYPCDAANIYLLSKKINTEIVDLQNKYNVKFKILSDVGEDLGKSLNATLKAALEGAMYVFLVSVFFISGKKNRNALNAKWISVLLVPMVFLISLGCISMLGFNFDKHVLSGLAVGLGVAIDTIILTAEVLSKTNSIEEGKLEMSKLTPALISGTATTLVVLFPLYKIGAGSNISSSILTSPTASLALSIAVLCVVAFAVSVVISPPLILMANNKLIKLISRNVSFFYGILSRLNLFKKTIGYARSIVRFNLRVLAAIIYFCVKRASVIIIVACVISVAGVASILLSVADVSASEPSNTLYIHAEFKSGATIDYIDECLAGWSIQFRDFIKARTGNSEIIKHIQYTARRGNASIIIVFDKKQTTLEFVSNSVRKCSLADAFFWMPESSSSECTWTVSFTGDDDYECRQLATESARYISSLPFVVETVLNFKEPAKTIVVSNKQLSSANVGIPFSSIAAALRINIHEPVAYKRYGPNGEMDSRISIIKEGKAEKADISKCIIKTDLDNGVSASTLVSINEESDISKIYRLDRRRAVSITVKAKKISVFEARRQILDVIRKNVAFNSSYTAEFDIDAVESANRLRGMTWPFVLALLLAYMVMAVVTESLIVPLIIIAAVPVSLSFPAICMLIIGMNFNASIACAFVAVSGMVVNASILTVEEARSQICFTSNITSRLIYRIIRNRISVLFSTTLTTVIGALPFLLLEDKGIAYSLSFVTSLGCIASFFVAIVLMPCLIIKFSKTKTYAAHLY